LPPNRKALGGRWVYKVKPITNNQNIIKNNNNNNNYNNNKENNNINNNNIINSSKEEYKFKSRWVVQGFNQIEGLDFLETFSTVCRPETYRIFFIIAI
ncbi:reverse transcriptase domain-containing protein, partial [Escherichia coli]|nr:reverse transcriptase domain-containing protein [Escherichia coli]